MIANHIRQLGYRIEDVRLILNSHAHFDHAGGISWLQRASGATVAASPASARALATGASQPDDPQYGEEASFPAIAHVSVIADGETLQVGPLLVTARFTPGHTPGGTTWTWRSCEGTTCYDIVYADSQTAISAKGFSFTHGKSYPSALQDFQRGLAIIEGLSCDILLTPHPDVAGLWNRLDRRKHGDAHALVDKSACKNFVAEARRGIAERVAAEEQTP